VSEIHSTDCRTLSPVAERRTSVFDYSALDPETAKLAKDAADNIHAYKRRATAAIIEIGKDLNKVKERLGYGPFGDWLREEFDWTERTAQRFMQVAAVFGDKSDIVSDLQPTILYQLSARSTPETIISKVVRQLEAGERLDVAAVHAEGAKARPNSAGRCEADAATARAQR
jgi:hypothetical protein